MVQGMHSTVSKAILNQISSHVCKYCAVNTNVGRCDDLAMTSEGNGFGVKPRSGEGGEGHHGRDVQRDAGEARERRRRARTPSSSVTKARSNGRRGTGVAARARA